MVLENVRESVDTEVLATLEEKKLFERVPDNTRKALEVMKNDTNKNLSSRVDTLVQTNEGKLGLEEIADAIDMHIWNKQGEVLDVVRVGDQDRNDIEKIDTKTMQSLKALCSDFAKIRADIEVQTEENAY
ncbi:hypothetical protein GYA44_00195 [Candidatus Microgenomates bacterium]|jgi:hypothetical protein|nr:hypothetical protein [Candidatus Microgenomates bacterium]